MATKLKNKKHKVKSLKKRSSLYSYILFSLLISLILAFIIFIFGIMAVDTTFNSDKVKDQYLQRVDDLEGEVVQYIDYHNLEYNYDNISRLFALFEEINIHMTIYQVTDNSSDFTKTVSISSDYTTYLTDTIDFTNSKAILNIEDKTMYTTITLAKLTWFFACFIIFIFIYFLLIRRPLKYVKVINTSISKIGKGDYSSTIKIKDFGELTTLAENVNQVTKDLKHEIDLNKSLEDNWVRLFTNLSHDIRSPLTVIMGYTELIKNKQYKSQAEFDSYLDIIDRKTIYVKELTDKLFTYSKVVSNDVTLNIETIDIVSFMNYYLAEQIEEIPFKHTIDKADIEIDPLSLKRIIDNIFINIKKHGEISNVSVALDQNNDYYILKIINYTKNEYKDPQKLLDRLTTTNNKNSSGLGLSIIKESLKQFKGDFEIDYNNHIFSSILKFKKIS